MRRSEVTVFPQSAKHCPRKAVIAQTANPMDRQSVFPLRTAPSQIIASLSRNLLSGHHQLSVAICFGKSV